MKYWVYINDKVDGPYDETKLVTLNGFSQDTLICSEEVASAGGQEWVKASSIFEFDEIPVDSVPQNATEQVKTQEQNGTVDAQTSVLLAKLESLTAGMSQLTNKLNSMQAHLDQALEQNKQLVQQVSQLQNPQQLSEPSFHTPDAKLNTITLVSSDVEALKQPATQEDNQDIPVQQDFPEQAAPKEEELVIRSALDSIYGEKPLENTDNDEAFQDLLPQKTAEKEAAEMEKIENELKFVPVQEEEISEPSEKESAVVPEALVTTPSAEDVAKDALIQELTASPQEDILDQIIKEHQEQETQPQIMGEDSSGWIAAGAAAGLASVATTAVDSVLQDDKPETETALPAEELPPATDEQAAFSIATDKENPGVMEPVFAANKMPEDTPVPQPEIKEENLASLESLDTLDNNSLKNETDEKLSNDAEPGLEQTTSPQEIVPTAALAQESTQEADGFYLKDTTPDTANEENAAVQAKDVSADSELPAEEPVFTEQASTENEDATPESPATAEQEGSVPATEEDVPVAGESIPTTEENVPATGENIPTTEENVPATEEDLPTTEESIPTTEGNVPATEEDLPATGESIPTTEKDLPATEGSSPTTEESAPVEEKEEDSTEAEPEHLLTDKDLQDAFGPLDEPEQAPQANTGTSDDSVTNENLPLGDFMQVENNNPNELTEIELKAGSTYLISDFVPPAEAAQNDAGTSPFPSAANQTEENKNQETIIQDMLTISNIWQKDQKLNAEGLPENITATQVGLENNIQTKRGATFDIKTVPMIPDPSASNRLAVNGLDDLNAQHELKTNGIRKSTKIVIGSLVALLAAIVLYVLLGLVQMLPSSINIFANKEVELPATEQASEEFLPVEGSSSGYEVETEPAAPSDEEVLSRVQNFNLPNGLTLKQVIEAKHANISPDLITWEVTEALEENSYVVTVKVPPENPQGYKTVYRYDYDMQTDMLNPTVSEAKNLLDQASQQQ